MDGWMVISSAASSRFARLDLNEEALRPMETDSSIEVPDTPDRVAARYNERNVACEDFRSSSSTSPHKRDGLRRRDGIRRRPRNLTYETRGSDAVTGNRNSSARRENLAGRKLVPREVWCPISGGGGNTERDLQDRMSVSGQAGVSGEKKHEVHRKVTDVRMNTRDSGIARCINGASDCRKDLNKHSGFDSSFQLINLESSPQSSAAANKMDSGSCESAEIRRGMHRGGRVNPGSDSQSRSLWDECEILTDQRMPMRNEFLSQRATGKSIKGGTRVGWEGRLSNKGTGQDKGKAIVLSPDSVPSSKAAQLSSSHVDAGSRIARSRGLVQNGFISPANIARSKSAVAEAKHFNSNNPVNEEAPQIVSPRQMHDFSHCNGKEKGKNILDEGHLHNSEVETKSSSCRSGTVAFNNVSDTDEDISWFVGEDDGWTTTGNRRGLSNGVRHSQRHGHENNGNEGQQVNIVHDIDASDSYASQTNGCRSKPALIFSNVNHDDENIRQQGTASQIKGKRKTRSGRSSQGQTSMAESSYLLPRALGESSNVSSTGTSSVEGCGTLSLSVVDVEEFSPRIRRSRPRSGNISVSDPSSERALQVESDALLARQLQEQIFNESLGSGSFEEIDTNIAWRLQEEEDAQIPSSTGSEHQLQPRDPSMRHLYGRYWQHSSQNPSRQLPRQRPSMPRISQLRRNFNRRQLDLESRLNYLEALEAVFDHINDPTSPTSLLHVERDFNENDYEMLLALDNENHNHSGASNHQINNLPLSVVQTENSEETCPICLDAPSIGDKIRHLPCLHKFHKDCIDTWLKRKTSCPVCKSDVT